MSYTQYAKGSEDEEDWMVQRTFTAKTAFHDMFLERTLRDIIFGSYVRHLQTEMMTYNDNKSVLVFIAGPDGTKQIQISAPLSKMKQAEQAIQKSVLFEITRERMKTENGCEYEVAENKRGVEKSDEELGPTIVSAFQLGH